MKKQKASTTREWHGGETERKGTAKSKKKEIVRVELPAYLKTVEIAKSTVKYLIQHYGGQLKSIEEWQAVVKGITGNPVS